MNLLLQSYEYFKQPLTHTFVYAREVVFDTVTFIHNIYTSLLP